MKQVNEDLAIGFDSNGMEIKAERLQKWAYNQLASAPDLLEACKATLDIINSYSHIPAQFKACIILQQAIAKTERRE